VLRSDDSEKRKRRPAEKSKSRRKKSLLPRLIVVSVEPDGDVVECQLETGKLPTVAFRFSLDSDKTSDITNSLVSCFKIF
jgi:hypothetical protein